MKKLLFLCLSYISLISNAQTINIPDLEFLKDLIRQGIDKNKDGYIQLSEAESIEKIGLARNNISDLTGIEAFTSLKYLYCGYINITKLDVSKNTSLEFLNCYSNKLSTLDVSKNISLVRLECGYNQLNKLDVSQNPALTYLICPGNQLTILDITSNKSLRRLICGQNKLTSLDIANNLALDYLDCGANYLTTLNLKSNKALLLLSCYNNSLSDLDVSYNLDLRELNCVSNLLSYLEIGKNIKLDYLSCDNNQLKFIHFSNNQNFYNLSCSKNRLTDFDISKISITHLNCSLNPSLFNICLNNIQFMQTKPHIDEDGVEVLYWFKDSHAQWSVDCEKVTVEKMKISNEEKKLIGIYNLIGQELSVGQLREGVYIYRYSDGSVKRIWNNNSN